MKEMCKLGAGQGFGHEALIHQGNLGRIGAVKCLTECHIISVSKHEYQKLKKRFDDREKEQSLKFYRDLTLRIGHVLTSSNLLNVSNLGFSKKTKSLFMKVSKYLKK